MTIRNIDAVFDEAKRFRRENRRNYGRRNTRKSPGKGQECQRDRASLRVASEATRPRPRQLRRRFREGRGSGVAPRRLPASGVRLGGGDAGGRRADGSAAGVPRGRPCAPDQPPCGRGRARADAASPLESSASQPPFRGSAGRRAPRTAGLSRGDGGPWPRGAGAPRTPGSTKARDGGGRPGSRPGCRRWAVEAGTAGWGSAVERWATVGWTVGELSQAV